MIVAAAVITPDVRRAVFAVWNGICAYCKDAPASHVDHIIPRSLGGVDDYDNYAAACSRCNLRKGANMLADGYLYIIAAMAKNRSVRAARLARSCQVARRPKKALSEISETIACVKFPRWAWSRLIALQWQADGFRYIKAETSDGDLFLACRSGFGSGYHTTGIGAAVGSLLSQIEINEGGCGGGITAMPDLIPVLQRCIILDAPSFRFAGPLPRKGGKHLWPDISNIEAA